MDKKELINNFQRNPQRYWKVKLFDDLDFQRKKCKNCGKFFWTLTNQEICNDSTCKPFEFIGHPPTKKKLDFFETWEVIKKFFVKKGHTVLKPYPLASRWYPLLYFTNAGIVNFYRIDENGKLDFEFPANPSILTQPCLRFVDLPNVGLNNKSYSCFFMIQQTSAHGYKNGYWKDEAVELDFELLTKVFGIPPEEIVFIEDAWLSPVAFGPSLEYHVQGLELGNIVFTEFEGTPNNYREMENKIIDMGAGHERFTWITQGTPTSYEAVFGPILKRLRKIIDLEYDKDFFIKYSKYTGLINVDEFPHIKIVKTKIADKLGISFEQLQKKVEQIEALNIIAEHSRALALAIGQGNLPSNIGGGYNLRVILRRALSFIDKFNWDIKLEDVTLWHINLLKKFFPDLAKHKDEIVTILKVEEKRYRQTKERSKRIVESLVGRKLTEEDLIKIYESEGITPEQLEIEVPEEFYKNITERHIGHKKIEREKYSLDVSNLPATKILYYDEPYIYKFKAKVLRISGNFIILDKTAFYPESGGQKADRGYINGIKVIDVQKIGSVIVHRLDGELKVKEGEHVSCKVDRKRREILMKHHDAIHIISGAAKKILGRHIHQYGAEKDVDKARIDLTHFESLSWEELEKIENLANRIVKKNLSIKKISMDRGEAEMKYGFDIYAGGYVPSKQIRIIDIGNGFDVEACGGTHGNKTKEVGWIKIIRSRRIADGLVRLEIVAGEVAEKYLKEKEKILKEVSKKLKVKEEEEVPQAVEELFREWKKLRKQLKDKKVDKNDVVSRV